MYAQAEVISFYEKLGWVGIGERFMGLLRRKDYLDDIFPTRNSPFMEANIEHLVMVLLPK